MGMESVRFAMQEWCPWEDLLGLELSHEEIVKEGFTPKMVANPQETISEKTITAYENLKWTRKPLDRMEFVYTDYSVLFKTAVTESERSGPIWLIMTLISGIASRILVHSMPLFSAGLAGFALCAFIVTFTKVVGRASTINDLAKGHILMARRVFVDFQGLVESNGKSNDNVKKSFVKAVCKAFHDDVKVVEILSKRESEQEIMQKIKGVVTGYLPYFGLKWKSEGDAKSLAEGAVAGAAV